MQNKGTDYIRRLLKDKTRLKRWRKMILCLSCVVVFCTVYALILPAITLERKTVCGQEEHSHTEECYSSDGQLTCGKTEHIHTESCYADDKTSEDQSGEDSQQTPEQGQTEGQEQNQGQSQEQNQNQSQDQSKSQNQVQTSDDGNVAQNGENGDTAGTTADAFTVYAEGNVGAVGAPALAAEGEGGTGSTTTEGFDLSASATTLDNKVKSVALYYQKEDGTWKEILPSESEIPGNAKIKLSVAYENVQIRNLIDTYNCTLTYDLPELFRNATTINGAIMEGMEQVGTLSVSGEKIKVQFKKEYLENKIKTGTTTIEGNFYILGDVNLSKVDQTTGQTTLQTAGRDYTLDFGPDAIAKYGNVSVQKTCTSEKAISTPNGNFLSYTVTVTAGEDGCPDVSVVDSLTSNSDCVTYVGITSNAKDLAGISNEQNPYETMDTARTSGKIYKGNAPTTENSIPTAGATSIKEPGSLVWKIGNMAPNESRTLTYYVKLKDDVALDNKEIKNQANVYSKTYKRVDDDATFTPKISYTMPKSRVGNIEKNTEGSYTINYRLDFTLDQANSNYPLENFVFQDYLKHDSNATASEALPYISYDRTSVHVFVKKDGATDYTELKTEYSTSWSNDMNTYKTNWSDSTDGNPNSFKISGTEGKPIQVNPGDSYYVTYSVKVKPEALAAVKSDNVRVNNRWIASASNANKDFKTGFNAWNNNNDVGGYKWDEKVVGTGTPEDQTIQMTGNKYNLTSGKIQSDTSEDTSFTVPKGSYPYTVDVNQTFGDWNATNVLMKDTLDSDKMQYTGYAKVDAYSYNAGTEAYDLHETKWVKIDGLKTFALKPSDLGWSGNYAYKFTYYAKPVNTDTFSTAIVNNKFELSGEVIRGGQRFDITGINSQKEVTISGEYRMSVKKESWYYEKPEAGVTEWTKGKIYWVIEVSGTAIKEGTYFKDSIASGSDLTNSIIKEGSLEGIYKGVLPNGKTLTGYSSLKELKEDAINLTEVTGKFDVSSQSNSELQVKAKEQITLGQEKLYIIVRTEPEALPVKDRDYNTYRNSISTSDDGKTWIKQGEASKLLCGAGDILKEFGQSFTYDGTTVISKKDGRDDGDSGKIAKAALPGAGQYASWVFKLNYAGEMSGTYRVLESIPDGMELAYIRIKWTGTKQGTITSKEDVSLENEGWAKKTVTANTDNGNRSETTTYYVKGNKAVIELGDFKNGKIRDDYSVDVQVVCRVTDPEVLLGGKIKKFMNQVTLQTSDGQNINTATSPADIKAQKIEKSMAGTNPVSEKINFTIKANQLGQTLPTLEGTTLKLIDKMSSTLILDTTTIKVVNSNNGANVDFTASLEGNTLTIAIPCDVPVTITYTASVNAPPGQSVSFSNEAYWETYTPSSGTSVKQDNYSYNAGGTVVSGNNITLKIIKKDQYNLSHGLEGAVFRLTKCTRNDDGTIKDDTDKRWNDGTTNSNGEIQFGAGASGDPVMDYNTLYKVTEVTAPAGYVKDDTPHYIMVPRKESGATEYADYVKKCMEDARISIQYQSIYELTISNHKGEITVEKKFKNPGGQDSNPVSGVYKFGLYEKSDATNNDGTNTPKQKLLITYTAGDMGVKTAKFINLDPTATYYVFELDDSGNPIKNPTTVATVNRMEYFTSYETKNSGGTTSQGNSAINGDTVTVTNQSRVNKLPSTGSCGVLIYRLAGAILILFAVVLMLMKYKETKTRN